MNMCIIEWIESVYSQSIRAETFLVLVLIGIVFVLSLLFSKRKKVHLTILISMVVFYIFAKVHCGASLKDVSVMKPMAEAISNYIVKNGIPKSLEDIPDLPYELECGQSGKECSFRVKNAICDVSFYGLSNNKYQLDVFIKTVETGLAYSFQNEKGKLFLLKDDSGAYSTKTTGICNPMRQ
jgi:hypothetical protein